MNEANVYTSNGTFTFNGQVTGDALADFFLGKMSTFQQSTTEGQNWRQHVLGMYAEDEIHLSSHLLLTAGLRWEPFFPTPDNYGRGNHYDPVDFAHGKTTSKYTNAPPGLLFAGDPTGITNGYTNANYNLPFEPRGWACVWDPNGNGKQTIRASYGIFYDTMMLYYNDRFRLPTPPRVPSIAVNSPTGQVLPIIHGPASRVAIRSPYHSLRPRISNFLWVLHILLCHLTCTRLICNSGTSVTNGNSARIGWFLQRILETKPPISG